MSNGIMAQATYPYLDLSVLPDVRHHLVSPHAALLFTADLKTVLWSNSDGASLWGAPTIAALLESETAPNPAMLRQIAAAANKLDARTESSGSMRVRVGFKTRLIGFTVHRVILPDDAEAILLTTERLHPRSFDRSAIAQSLVESLDGHGHACAVLTEDGSVVASSAQFSDLDIEGDDLRTLCEEVAREDDHLIKRPLTTPGGDLPAGIAYLGAEDGCLLVIAEPGEAASTSAQDAPTASFETDDKAEEQTDRVNLDNGGEQEPETEPARLFSNRREKPGSNTLGRWYYRTVPNAEKAPTEVAPPDEQQSDENGDAAEHSKPVSVADGDTDRNADVDPDIVEAGGLRRIAGPDEDVETPPSPGENEGTEAPEEDRFNFSAAAKPIRFVWEMDTGNAFRSVSAELARAVGPRSADIVGLTWEEVGELRAIENAAEISTLLDKGDTWSGKTVLWPVEGTDLRVPIDLAGLPSYSRNRNFDGFTGFGIARTADAIVDPAGTGLKISLQDDNHSDGQDAQTEQNIVDLHEQRQQRALSSGEKAAFQEIAEKLSDDGDADQRGDEPEASGNNDNSDFIPSAFAVQPLRSDEVLPAPTKEEKREQKDGTAQSDVDTSILARLPIPVLVYRGEELLFGNDAFFGLTGYADLHDFSQAGGIERLYGPTEAPEDNADTPIFHRDGRRLSVQAHLQSVPWDNERAMLLTLRRRDGDDRDDEDAPDPADLQSREAGEQTDATSAQLSDPSKNDNQNPPSARLKTAGDLPLFAENPDDDIDAVPAFGGLDADDLRNILDVATDGIIILSDDGIVRALNKSAEALFDIRPAQIAGQSVTRLLAPESRRAAMDYLSSISGPGVASLLNDGREIIGRTDKGGLIPLFMTIGKLEKTDACCAVMRDITQWKRAEEELLNAKARAESASAQKSDFLAKISHEIRTPLNAIIGFSDMMIEERLGRIENDRYRGYLRDIKRSGAHVLELINDLLDLSKIEAGKVELEFDACNLNAIVSETVALAQPDANKERVIIRTSLSAVVPKVVADPRSLRQIILNLVSNGIKFTKSGGQVIVSTVYDQSGEVVLRVRDTGVGMSDADLVQALQPFRQVQSVAGSQGTGLGLPLTKALVEANRAHFHIESEPDEGTLIEIHFPSQRVLADR